MVLYAAKQAVDDVKDWGLRQMWVDCVFVFVLLYKDLPNLGKSTM